jgi:hypothetical protein
VRSRGLAIGEKETTRTSEPGTGDAAALRRASGGTDEFDCGGRSCVYVCVFVRCVYCVCVCVCVEFLCDACDAAGLLCVCVLVGGWVCIHTCGW